MVCYLCCFKHLISCIQPDAQMIISLDILQRVYNSLQHRSGVNDYSDPDAHIRFINAFEMPRWNWSTQKATFERYLCSFHTSFNNANEAVSSLTTGKLVESRLQAISNRLNIPKQTLLRNEHFPQSTFKYMPSSATVRPYTVTCFVYRLLTRFPRSYNLPSNYLVEWASGSYCLGGCWNQLKGSCLSQTRMGKWSWISPNWYDSCRYCSCSLSWPFWSSFIQFQGTSEWGLLHTGLLLFGGGRL